MPCPANSNDDAGAGRWSLVARAYNWQLPLERAALAAAVELADPHPDDAVLDLGTGTGGLLRELASRPYPPAIAIGVDTSAAMLKRAPAPPQGWVLEAGDARQLRFADGTFSIVTAAYLLHIVDAPTRRQIIAEARRVLRPGGRFVAVTPAWPRSRLARMLYTPLAAAAGSSTDPRSAFRPLDLSSELEAANFTIAAARHVGRGYPSICVSAIRS